MTASLVQGDPTFDDYLYIGGHVARDQIDGDVGAHLAIFRYDYTTSETLMNLIMYGEDCDDQEDNSGPRSDWSRSRMTKMRK